MTRWHIVKHLGRRGPAAGGLIAVTILGGLTQRVFRAFGAREEGQASARSNAADDLKAAEGSRK